MCRTNAFLWTPRWHGQPKLKTVYVKQKTANRNCRQRLTRTMASIFVCFSLRFLVCIVFVVDFFLLPADSIVWHFFLPVAWLLISFLPTVDCLLCACCGATRRIRDMRYFYLFFFVSCIAKTMGYLFCIACVTA